jgi:phosphate transport system substrate-binding protein
VPVLNALNAAINYNYSIERLLMTWKKLLILSGFLTSFTVIVSVDAAVITGAGATFPYPIYSKWAEAYQSVTGDKLNYQSIGSGGGIKQITAGTVDFGASDMPLTPEELNRYKLVQWPMIIGGVVPVVNISGVETNRLKLTGEILADIYLGKIRKWNDSAIQNINNGLKLPDDAIAVVHRSDGSGTTFLFTNYLVKESQEWADKVGSNSSVQWPSGIGGKGNEGVANYVQQAKGSIGYVEYAYAIQNKLATAMMQNQLSEFLKPEIGAFQAAAANADWASAEDFYVILTAQPGNNSWPITGASFILMHQKQSDPERAKTALNFFSWCFVKGDIMAKQLDYVPIPAKVVAMVKEMWKNKIISDFKEVGY